MHLRIALHHITCIGRAQFGMESFLEVQGFELQ